MPPPCHACKIGFIGVIIRMSEEFLYLSYTQVLVNLGQSIGLGAVVRSDQMCLLVSV